MVRFDIDRGGVPRRRRQENGTNVGDKHLQSVRVKRLIRAGDMYVFDFKSEGGELDTVFDDEVGGRRRHPPEAVQAGPGQGEARREAAARGEFAEEGR